MRNLSTLYYRNRYLLVLTILVLLVGGLASVFNLPRLEDPRITLRGATVITFLPGASAERVDALINEKIEEALEEIDSIKKLKTKATAGVSSIQILLADSVTRDTNQDIFSRIRSKLRDVETQLPADASIPFLDDQRSAAAYNFIAGIRWHGDDAPPLSLLQRLANDLQKRLLNTPNTELVRIFGGVDEEIIVEPRLGDLAALGLTPEQLSRRIAQADSKSSAGQFRGNTNNIQIEVRGELDGVARVAAIPLDGGDGLTTVGDIATVRRGFREPPRQMGWKDGSRMLYVAARSDEYVRADLWSARAKEILADFATQYSDPIGVELIFDQNTYTEERLNGLVFNLIAGALLVIFIVFLTMGWKSGVVVGAALPLSAGGALFTFTFFGQTIHQMSIFGMIIASGLLIDSAIVMTDEVRKRMRDGMRRVDAVDNAVRHLFVPLLASTFTTILGFMPIFLLPGNAGDFVSPIAISVVMALIISLFLSVTVVPAVAANAAAAGRGATARWWQRGIARPKVAEDFYRFTLHALQRPKRYMLLAIAPCLLGFALMGTMEVEFFPAGDRDMFEIQLWMPSSSAIEKTRTVVAAIDDDLHELEGVTQVHWLIGASTPPVYYNQLPTQDNNNAYAQAVVVCESPQRANEVLIRSQNLLASSYPEARIIARAFSQGPPSEAPIIFRIEGPSLHTLRELGERVREFMHRSPAVVHTRSGIEGGAAKLWLEADEVTASQAGLELRSVARQWQGYLDGLQGGSVLEDSEELPVRVRCNDSLRSDLATVATLPLISAGVPQWIPTESIGTLSLKPATRSISRYNGRRSNTIYAYITPQAKAVSTAASILAEIEADLELPPGYSISVAGDSEQQADAVGNLLIYAPILVILMAATLILAFRSVALAGLIGVVALLSIGLGMLSLKIAGYPLGFNPLIGSIGLAGVAINDTIVVFAAILDNPRAKRGDPVAIMDETLGCGRHVVSTSLTTLAGFVPLLLFSGGSFWPPLAVVIAGGIGLALILALFFTPLAYKAYIGTET